MTPERWSDVERVYHAALTHDAPQRGAFLAEACAGDEALRREVESMLASERAAAGFMSTPAVDSGMLSPAASFVGRQLGPYTIQSPLGVGGMGEVYRARDSKLGRDVAIKILPRIFTSDPDRLARFEREARLLASLNHPNIGAIYGLEEVDGIPALVLELVEGDTLAERIARRGGAGPSKSRGPVGFPLALREALTIARQIADALEAAHEKGIVHRDLKPANIKITPAGVVKVLDFGLAKFGAGGAGEAGLAGAHDLTKSPTMMSGTCEGVILGTAAYMSPEQAQGKTADARSDIWAFGVVLYEMLTGKSGFGGDTAVEVLSNVLKTDPDWTALPASIPPSIRSLLRRCVQKDPRQRLRDIADARFQIEEALNEPITTPLAVAALVPARKGRERLLWAALAVAAIAAVVSTALFLGRARVDPSEVRFEIVAPPTSSPDSLAISPDGRNLVFSGSADGHSRLWLRPLDSALARQLSGTDNARYPFWSPDGRSLGFFADAQLKRLDLDTGFVQALAAAPATFGGTWNREGTILYCPSSGGPVFRISAGGGQPTAVTQTNPQMAFHMSPQFLPDGRHFLFWTGGTAHGIYAGQLDGSKPLSVLDAEAAMYSSSGYLLFLRQDTLFAQKFDPVRLALAGNPAAIADHVVAPFPGRAAFSASESGPIVYRTGPPVGEQFVWFDRSGKALEKVAGSEISKGTSSSLSPDGRRLAMEVNGTSAAADLWLLDLERGVPTRFTFDPAYDLYPVWSPEGNRIAFSSNRGKEGFDLYLKSATGVGSEAFLLGGEGGQLAEDWSPDGRFLLYTNNVAGSRDIWALPLGGDRKPFPVAQTAFAETSGRFSPDGQWVAYQSNESGRFEIWVQPFPGPGAKSQISNGGGVQVRWRPDGKELFYLTPDDRLMAAPIRLDGQGKTVDVGTPVSLFAAHLPLGSQNPGTRFYHVSRDGQRFLMLGNPEVTLPITVILNWKPKP